MLTENDLKQIKNLVLSFYKEKKYFPFVEDLQKKYSILFPNNLDEETKNQIDNFINDIIIEEIKKKKTKWGLIMSNILKHNDDLWKKFRKLNSPRFFEEKKFQELGKKVEKLMFEWEDKLTEKLIGSKSIWIQKASDAWFDMVYAIFPEWNKIS